MTIGRSLSDVGLRKPVTIEDWDSELHYNEPEPEMTQGANMWLDTYRQKADYDTDKPVEISAVSDCSKTPDFWLEINREKRHLSTVMENCIAELKKRHAADHDTTNDKPGNDKNNNLMEPIGIRIVHLLHRYQKLQDFLENGRTKTDGMATRRATCSSRGQDAVNFWRRSRRY